MDAFEQAVREALKPIAGTFAYESMVQNHLNIDKYRPWAEIINRCKPVRDQVIFCSGCGSGNEFPSYFDLGASRVYGIEVEQPLVDLARLRFAGTPQEHQVDVRLYDGNHLPYDDDAFDIISSMHVVEHVKDPHLYISELCRVLKPGGIIFMDYPNRFYPVEQHTGIKWIHLLPHPLMQALVACVLDGKLDWLPGFHPEKIKFKALEGYCPPFPGGLVDMFCKHGKPRGIEIEQATFHDYGAVEIPYRSRWHRLRTVFFKMTSFRLLLRRQA